jgi:hypothetical protein
MIKLKTVEQVEISEGFKQLAREFFEEKLSKTKERKMLANANEICKVLEFYQTKEGFEVFLTRMKQLPFSKFEAISSLGEQWFKATIKDLIFEVPYEHHERINRKNVFVEYKREKYDVGTYFIYLPMKDLLKSSMDRFHLIPERNLKLTQDYYVDNNRHNRHLHHYAICHNISQISNPLAYEPRTCWGNFGGIISASIHAGDIPELYRALYLFTTIQNISSPLVYLESMEHYRLI